MERESEFTYLLDANIIIHLLSNRAEELQKLEKNRGLKYVITNKVLMEVMDGEMGNVFPRISEEYQVLLKHIVNDGLSMDPGWKENRIIKEIDGKLFYEVAAKVSSEDYGMITYAQNHSEIVIVSEDRKLRNSAIVAIGKDRVIDFQAFFRIISKL